MKNEHLKSNALAFWANHSSAMDHLYAEYFETPPKERNMASSLNSVVNNAKYAGQVNEIINQAIKDKSVFLGSVRQNIAKYIAKKCTVVKPRSMNEGNVSKNEWSFNLYLENSNDGPKFNASFFVLIDADYNGQQAIIAKLWVNKKNSGRQLDAILPKELFKFKDIEDRKKQSVTLFSKPIMMYMNRKRDSVNLSKIENDILEIIKHISAPLWKKILALE